MSVTDVRLNSAGLPVGTWVVDPVHSSASFAVKHHAVSTFRGRFEKLDATLTVDEDSPELVGTVDASSIVVKDDNQQAHLGSPDFFDVERYPEITYRSTSIRRQADELIVDGELTIKGHAQAVESHGTIDGPEITQHGTTNLGITPAQLALAWVLAQGEDLVPIPGTKRRTYLEQNAAAVDVELTEEDLARIDADLPAAAGARYNEAGMASVDL